VVSVRVPLVERRDASYEVLIGSGLLQEVGARLRTALPAARHVVIADAQVAALYGERLVAACRGAGLHTDLLDFPAGEPHKTRDTWADLSDRLLDLGVGRDGAIIALGGGVTGDLAGFVAAAYLRGIPYAQIPTTLMAMVDSSIGGKTGVDTPAGKNLVGAFHQPRLVVADVDVLSTLPAPHLRAGMAEAIKHAVIADAGYFETLERDRAALLKRDGDTLSWVVARSVEIKASIVTSDEREAGGRAVLNFGHTVGHALEASGGYALLHGEAVAMGMAVEGRLAEEIGVAETGTARRIEGLLEAFGLPGLPSRTAPMEELLAVLRRDKKSRDAQVRMALPRRVGLMAGSDAEGWTVPVAEEVLRRILGRCGVDSPK
jgi:3-dehydroquinate synthase